VVTFIEQVFRDSTATVSGIRYVQLFRRGTAFFSGGEYVGGTILDLWNKGWGLDGPKNNCLQGCAGDVDWLKVKC
jgi:hypothetical protein